MGQMLLNHQKKRKPSAKCNLYLIVLLTTHQNVVIFSELLFSIIYRVM
jgi:hypothetical protein